MRPCNFDLTVSDTDQKWGVGVFICFDKRPSLTLPSTVSQSVGPPPPHLILAWVFPADTTHSGHMPNMWGGHVCARTRSPSSLSPAAPTNRQACIYSTNIFRVPVGAMAYMMIVTVGTRDTRRALVHLRAHTRAHTHVDRCARERDATLRVMEC